MVLVCSSLNDLTVTALTASWTQVILLDLTDTAISGNRLPAQINQVQVYSTCDQPLEIGVGIAAEQAIVQVVPPDFNQFVSLLLSKNQSIWVRCPSGSSSIGRIQLNFMRGARG